MYIDLENDFGTDSAALQAAIDAITEPSLIKFRPGGVFNIADQVFINSKPSITFEAHEATVKMGANQLDNERIINIDSNGFSAYGGTYLDVGKKVVAFCVLPSVGDVSDFTFRDMKLLGELSLDPTAGFKYAIRFDGDDGKIVRKAHVDNIISTAPVGRFSAHILGDHTDQLTVKNCKVYGGLNHSQIGVADSTNFQFIGNQGFGNEDGEDGDAFIQVEDSPSANGIIKGNIGDHDIWVDDSTIVTIGHNHARRLRFTVNERSNSSIECHGGNYSRISVASIGTVTPGAFRSSVYFNGVTLLPHLSSEDYGIHAAGSYAGELAFDNLRFGSNGTVANVSMSRNADAHYYFRGGKIGGTKTISGTGGTLSVSDVRGWTYP